MYQTVVNMLKCVRFRDIFFRYDSRRSKGPMGRIQVFLSLKTFFIQTHLLPTPEGQFQKKKGKKSEKMNSEKP